MKKRIVSLLLILCTVFSILALASCNKDGNKAETTAQTAPGATETETEATTVEVTTDKW